MQVNSKYVHYLLVGLLYAVLVTPLMLSSKYLFPFITTKTMFFRIVVEIAVVIYLFLALIDKKYRPRLNKLNLAVIGFGLIVLITAVVGLDFNKSFWGTIERGEGFLTISHVIVYFLILSWSLKSKKQWLGFFTGLVVVGLLVDLYAMLQVSGTESFFLFGRIINSGESRISATLGNAAFMGAFVLAQFFLSLLLLLKYKNWWIKSLFVIPIFINLFILYKTETRGAILSLVATLFLLTVIYIVKSPDVIKRKIAGVVLLIMVVFTVTVFGARGSDWVKNDGTLNRIVSISKTDITTESRLLSWDTSYKGLKDRFLLGYGWENYSIAFNKYFHSEIYKDAGSQIWFDRAHNTIFDIAIATGIVGLLVYLYMYFEAIKSFYNKAKEDFDTGVVLLVLLIAHFIQNIFVFDVLSTFVVLFTVFAYASYLSTPAEQASYIKDEKFRNIWIGVAPIVLLLIILSFYHGNIKPLEANEMAISGMRASMIGNFAESTKLFKEAIDMGTYQSQEIRQKLANQVLGESPGNFKTEKEYIDRVSAAIDGIKDNIKEHPYDIQNHLYLMTLLNRVGQSSQVEEVGRQALSMSPNRAHFYYEMGQAAIILGDYNKGIEYFEKATQINPKTLDAHWNLLSAYIVAGRDGMVKKEIVNMQNLGYDFNNEESLKRIHNVYVMAKRENDFFTLTGIEKPQE